MRPVDYATLTEKRCPKCQLVLPVSAFYKIRRKEAWVGWSYSSRCSDCTKADNRSYRGKHNERRTAKARQWRQENPEKARLSNRRIALRNRYGLTIEQAEALLRSTGGLCMICGESRELVIDHCHRTGVVRGVLCNGCNAYLGRVERNPRVLRRLRAYLKQNGSPVTRRLLDRPLPSYRGRAA